MCCAVEIYVSSKLKGVRPLYSVFVPESGFGPMVPFWR